MSKLKQKHIQHFLQDMQDFQYGEKDKIHLQQHMTPPDITAKLLYHIYLNEPIQDMLVADLGTGTGMLITGLVYIGSLYAVGVELDEKYVGVTKEQLDDKVEDGLYEVINANIARLRFRHKSIDLVVMNPPFGTKQQNIDTKFLQFAMNICNGNIYSMHKSSTRPYLIKFCAERGYNLQVLMQVKFPLKKRFKNYHKKDVAYTDVDIVKVTPVKKKNQEVKEEMKMKGKKEQQENGRQSKQEKVKVEE